MVRMLTVLIGTAAILWLILPAIIWYSRKHVRLLQKHLAVPFFVAVLLGSVLYVGSVRLADQASEHALHKFDLDGNGEFSKTELTPEAQVAMRRFSNNTGRSLAPVVAVPATLLLSAGWFSLLWLGTLIARRVSRSA